MKHKNIIICILLVFFFNEIYSQQSTNPDTVCVGSNVYYKIQKPNKASIFKWGVYNNTGTITSGDKTDSIRVAWSSNAGVDSIWVYETNTSGCLGDTSILKVVRLAPPSAQFATTAVCSGDSLSVCLTGLAPFVLDYTLNDKPMTETNINNNVYFLKPSGSYSLIRVADRHCVAKISGSTSRAVIAPPLDSLVLKYETNPDTVCQGHEIFYKIQNSIVNSKYYWETYNNTGIIKQGNPMDSIGIFWTDTSLSDSLWFFEINHYGCVGDTSVLRIHRVAAPSAQFENASLCFGAPLNVNCTGTAPFSIGYTLNNDTLTVNGFTKNIYQLNSVAGNYILLHLTDRYCTKKLDTGVVSLKVAQPLNTLEIYLK
ncbi:MAG: hypothetical protein JW922_01125 [Paludibacteraceae bacterium]|nr:hypothetical protein [Paludibacteraceae bacterium]